MTRLDLDPATDRPKLGRPRDHTRDPEILKAALEVLAETGYDDMTVDLVATRAKAGKATLYRRWPTKGDLVLDAISLMKRNQIDPEALPDTGVLRADLLALAKPPSMEEAARRMQIMAGLVSMLSRDPRLADAANRAIVEPGTAVHRALLNRAVERGEIRADCDIETVSLIVPSMTAYRALVLRRPVDRAFLVSLVDGVVLPAVGLRAG